MEVKIFTIIHFLTIVYLSSSDESYVNRTAYIALPLEGIKPCIIGEGDCNLEYIRERLVELHNIEREHVTIGSSHYQDMPIATNMLLMERDFDLEIKAQKVAIACQDMNIKDCLAEGEKQNEGDVVISIKTFKIEKADDVIDRLQRVLAEWAATSLDDFSKSDIAELVKSFKTNRKSLRRWVKFIQAKVWKVGCGFADFFRTSQDFKEIVVCFYGPPKFQSEDEIYRPGCKPCSHCPKGTSCAKHERFKDILCEVTKGSVPVPEKYDKSIEENCFETTITTISETSTESTSIPPGIAIKQSENVLWECTLENYTNECMVEPPCSPFWEVDAYGSFKKITLSGRCVTASIFEKQIEIEEPSCFKFQYMKEKTKIPSFDSTVSAFAVRVDKGDGTVNSKTEDADEWTDIALNVPWNKASVEIGVLVRSLSPSGIEQIIKARNFEVLTGTCSL